MSHFLSEPTLPPAGPDNRIQTRTLLFRAAVARSWPALVALTLVGGLAGVAVGTNVSEPRTATAVILLNPLEGNAFYPSTRGEQLVNLFTEAQVLRSNAVAATVPATAGGKATVEQVLANVEVSVPPNTQILQISYTNPNPTTATNTAQGFADAYLKFRRTRAANSVSSRVTGTKTEIAAHETDLTRLTAQLAAARPGSAAAGLLLTQVQSVATQISQLNARLGDIASTALDPGQVITPAKLQPSGLVGLRELLILGGALLGLLLGLGLAFLRTGARSHSLVRSATEMEAFRIRTLATQSYTPDAGDDQLFRAAPAEINAGYLQFGAQLLDLTRHHRSKSVLVSPSRARVMHPLSVAPMAWSLAAAGIKTIVVDTTGELVPPTMATGHEPSLVDVLRDGLPIERALIPVAPCLQVIGSGVWGSNDEHLDISPRLTDMINSLADQADIVLIAAGSLLNSDAQLLASSIKSAVVEIEFGRSRLSDLRSVAQVCNDLSINLLGAVVLKPRKKQHPALTAPPVEPPAADTVTGGGLDRVPGLISSGSHGD
ncbi:hypothetical protein IV498_07035 [Paenarthrobacter sp. Z7-10]|uniref:hypothetical protein n=1 Tax=Paenarthrobacter sp. Z7-10 TaxID=2787635 RepID=UPI0022A96359|nr:hypothetical protein [Paenarthrobacter sp. Z7-10]MCZ2402944.1 hypothetical protein [Paenarthrobacter sp. Z7-10]